MSRENKNGVGYQSDHLLFFFFKRVKNALETICGLINEQRKSKRKKKLGSWMSSHWCNFYFVVPGHQICQKPRLICQIRWPIIFSSLDGIYKQQKAKKKFLLLQIEDFDFSMSRENAYYQFYKNAPLTHTLSSFCWFAEE